MMMSTKLFVVALTCLSGLLPAVATAESDSKCIKDACLSVVQHGHKPLGPGACNGFVRATVIPKTVTETTTKTVSLFTSKTRVVEATSFQTFVSISTDLIFETDVSFTTVSATTVHNVGKRSAINKPVTTSATAVPKYASSACQSSAAYLSACSCVGHVQTTTTVAAPTVTKVFTKFHHSKDISFTTEETVVPTTTVKGTSTTSHTTTTRTTALITETPFQIQGSGSGTSADGAFLESRECASSGCTVAVLFNDPYTNQYPVEMFYLEAGTNHVTLVDGAYGLYNLGSDIVTSKIATTPPNIPRISCPIDPDTNVMTCFADGSIAPLELSLTETNPVKVVVGRSTGPPITFNAVFI